MGCLSPVALGVKPLRGKVTLLFRVQKNPGERFCKECLQRPHHLAPASSVGPPGLKEQPHHTLGPKNLHNTLVDEPQF